MLKVIDLDNQGKENDGFVFVLTIGGERLGVTDQEVIELVKQKYSTSKTAKRATGKKGSNSETNPSDSTTSLGELDSRTDGSTDQSPVEASTH